MGNIRNRQRKKVRIPPSKRAKRFKDGGRNVEGDQKPVPSEPKSSEVKILGDVSSIFHDNHSYIDHVGKGIIFINLYFSLPSIQCSLLNGPVATCFRSFFTYYLGPRACRKNIYHGKTRWCSKSSNWRNH